MRSPTHRPEILLSSVFFLLSFVVQGQQRWVEQMKDPSVGLDSVRNSFEAYWQGETGPGWKQFKRWEYFVSPRIRSKRERITGDARWRAWKAEQAERGGVSAKGDWDYIGNDDIPMYGGAGRINCITVHPKEPQTIFAGSASGGLWKSTDDGMTWIPMTDDQPVLGVSQLVIHPSDPDTMYMATGDGDGTDTYSIGILKTKDGGTSWSTVGWTFTQSDNVKVHHLVMNPKDPSILLVSTNNGLYKTLNGGKDWYKVANGRYGDIAYKPGDTSVVYSARSGSSAFMRSNDGGESFSVVSIGTPASSDIGRLEIAVSQADPSRVYFVAGDASSQGFYGLYRSDDAGQSFTLTTDTPNVLGYSPDGSGSGGQAWYDLAITAHPQNADHLYVGGINIWRSTDGGQNFDIRTHWWGAQNIADVHADQHHLSVDRNGRLWAGNDGGVFMSPDLGDSWNDRSDGLHIAQLYRLGQSATDPELILTGWQDNGTNRRNSDTAWYRVIGGDGMECIIDHSDPSTMYGTLYFGRLYRSKDKGSSFSTIVRSDSSGVHESGGWVTPYMMDPQNSNELVIGKKDLYKSTDQGDSWWKLNSGPMGSGNFKTLAQCNSAPGHIYAAKHSTLWKRVISSSSFVERDSGLPVAQLSITHLEAHKEDPYKAWVTFSGYEAQKKVYYTSDGGKSWSNRSQGLPNVPANCVVHAPGSPDRVYVGTDLGVYYRDSTMNTFKPFNDGLPNVIVNELAVHKGAKEIRAATYGRGLWSSELPGYEPLSVGAPSSSGEIELYPNPSDGRLKGRLQGVNHRIELVVRDASGRPVQKERIDAGRSRFHIDLSHLESGLYFVRVLMEDGAVTKKVMLR